LAGFAAGFFARETFERAIGFFNSSTEVSRAGFAISDWEENEEVSGARESIEVIPNADEATSETAVTHRISIPD
jgi:hypothetical protein